MQVSPHLESLVQFRISQIEHSSFNFKTQISPNLKLDDIIFTTRDTPGSLPLYWTNLLYTAQNETK